MLQRSIAQKSYWFASKLGEIRSANKHWRRIFGQRHLSLKARLGIGAGILGLATLITALIIVAGMGRVSDRLQEALAAERRLEDYAALSTQVSTYILVAAELIQSDQPADTRAARTAQVVQTLQGTFARLRGGLDAEVAAAKGLDAQSRRATLSLALARMEAQLNTAQAGLLSKDASRAQLRAHLDGFASAVEPLLAEAVNEERRLRREILSGIDALRHRLTLAAAIMAGVALLLTAGFYLFLLRPQFRRLDALQGAARRIGQEDFSVSLPGTRQDEIGRLYTETNRMAQALAARASTVARDRARLEETIASRTEALRAANARLERTDEDRRRFFADISHELRTPLTVILMEAQLGRRGAPQPEEAFATIENRATRLGRRIDDLLRIARSETGQLALDPAPVDLAQLTTEAIAETTAELANAGMELQRPDPATAPLMVIADRNWLRQVISGLIRNAIRHARDGGLLRLELQAQGTTAELRVIDNGPGIPPAAQALVFDRFAQSGGQSAQGFGLGLPLARWVIEQQGGEITLQSPLPRDTALGPAPGTQLALQLPRAPQAGTLEAAT
ncbi:sensor histidine kinase [Salipiger sp. CCB-MM3]|uniref:sensor histidine kinase n=1 Tax=Salipiger sp. CCB-MM3 TaxID=1792508 RepID=UPI000A5168D0|nr:HAMP domain-containing sensor histidine kinase [Salipiger sp. CCB-MM3]